MAKGIGKIYDKQRTMSQEDALGWPNYKSSDNSSERPVNNLRDIGTINTRISDYKKEGMSEPDAIMTTAGDKSRAEGRPYRPGPDKLVQNADYSHPVFSSGTTENVLQNKGSGKIK